MVMIKTRPNLDLIQDSMQFVFPQELTEIGSCEYDLLNRVFSPVQKVFGLKHTSKSAFSKLSKSV